MPASKVYEQLCNGVPGHSCHARSGTDTVSFYQRRHNPYGLVRQGAELRIPVEESTFAPLKWDEEDQELLNSSIAEMESEVRD